MKKLITILVIIMAVFVISGCASRAAAISGGIVSTAADARMELRGEETATVWFGAFGTFNYPPFEKVARDNGITKIATVERYYKVGVFGLWVEYTTIVTGTGPGVAAEQ